MNKGGKMIDYGGYGCVFYPALLCHNKTSRRNGVSKLMMKKYGDKEYKIVSSITRNIKKIPNYEDYFIGPEIQKCKPASLTQGDKMNMKNCEPLGNNDIDENNINNKLSKVVSLDFQYGGEPLDNIIENMSTKEELQQLFRAMYSLLKHAIVPMNDLKIIHGDIKQTNILVTKSIKGYQCKLIDWGLSYTVEDNEQRSRPLQFNVPFSSILFRKNVDTFIEYFIESKGNHSASTCNELVKQILDNEVSSNDGHYVYFVNLYKATISSSTNDAEKFFIKYLSSILQKYLAFDNDVVVFKKEDYYNNVYIHNVDIWGFLSCFAYYVEHNSSKFYKKELKQLLKKYLFNEKYSTQKIPVQELLTKILPNKTKGRFSTTIKKHKKTLKHE